MATHTIDSSDIGIFLKPLSTLIEVLRCASEEEHEALLSQADQYGRHHSSEFTDIAWPDSSEAYAALMGARPAVECRAAFDMAYTAMQAGIHSAA